MITPLEGLLILTITSFLMWSPIFAFAYARRQFNEPRRGYIIAWMITSLITIGIFVLMTVLENANR